MLSIPEGEREASPPGLDGRARGRAAGEIASVAERQAVEGKEGRIVRWRIAGYRSIAAGRDRGHGGHRSVRPQSHLDHAPSLARNDASALRPPAHRPAGPARRQAPHRAPHERQCAPPIRRSLRVVEDDPQAVARAGEEARDAVTHRGAVVSAHAAHGTLARGEDDDLALLERERLAARLLAGTLLHQAELAAG